MMSFSIVDNAAKGWIMRRLTFLTLGSILAVSLACVVGGCTSGSLKPAAATTRLPTASPRSSGTVRAAAAHTVATLKPVDLAGRPPTQGELDEAVRVIERRFADAGLPAPSITKGPAHTLRFGVDARMTADQIQQLVAQGVVTLRLLLKTTTAVPAPRAIPSEAAPPSDPSATLDKAEAHVGRAAYALAESLNAPPTAKAVIAKLASFGTLTSEEVAVLPARMQFEVPSVTCAQLNARSPLFLTDSRYLDRQVTDCDGTQPNLKYLFGPAEVRGGDVARATAELDPMNYAATGGWLVQFDFTAAGEQKVLGLTTAQVGKQIGILMDGTLVSAPSIQEPFLGPVTAAGPYTTNTVSHRLAELVNDGTLPIQFAVTNVVTG